MEKEYDVFCYDCDEAIEEELSAPDRFECEECGVTLCRDCYIKQDCLCQYCLIDKECEEFIDGH